MAKTSPINRLLNLILLERREINSIYFYAILSGLVQLVVPIGVQSIVGFVLGASMATSMYVLIILVVIGVLLVGIFQINQMKIIEKVQQRIYTRYAFDFTERLPRFDLNQTDNLYLPEHVNKFFDVINVQKGLSKLLLEVPVASIQILFGLILLSFYHPIFIVFGVVLLAILLIILKVTSSKGLETSLIESKYKYSTVSWLQEMARVIKSFKFSQGSHLNLINTDKNVLGYLKARTSHFKILLIQYQTLVFFKVLITLAMLSIGSYLLIDQKINIGEFIAAEIVILMVIGAVEKLISSLDSVYDVITGLEKLATVIESPLETDGNIEFKVGEKGVYIDFVNFNFEYDIDKKIFNNLNLKIPANSIIAVNGQDGIGKTTLLRILSGNYRNFKGSLLLNNMPIQSYQLESLRKQIGVYLQQQEIFKGTVFENISMGRKEITVQAINDLSEKLGIHNFINLLSNGYETEIDSSGKKLPNSVIKKILLLRSLTNNPKLLLLDEPWLGMDDVESEEIKNYLLDRNQKRTTIVISQNESFTKRCDYIFMIKDNQINIIQN